LAAAIRGVPRGQIGLDGIDELVEGGGDRWRQLRPERGVPGLGAVQQELRR